MSKKNIIALSVLVFSFILCLVLFINNDNKYSMVSFKFYHEFEHKIVVEDRYVIQNGNSTHRAKIVVDELFLGPISVFNRKLVPFDFKYNHFYMNERVAYLDLPLKFITEYSETEYSIEETMDLIKENLINNIRGLSTVIITIEGDFLGAGPSLNALPQGE